MEMEKKEDYIEFLNSESYKTNLELWNRLHNITHEKTELYYDFLFSLTTLVDETYLGDDVYQNEEEVRNHFSWCINKVITNFEKEKIYFKKTGNYFEFLRLFFFGAFYHSENPNRINVVHEYFKLLFNENMKKTQLDLEMFGEFYKFLDQALKK